MLRLWLQPHFCSSDSLMMELFQRMAPSAYEVAFVSLAHDAGHIERAAQAFERALEAVRKEG